MAGSDPGHFCLIIARDVAEWRDLVGWAKARLRRAHHYLVIERSWARFALPTLREQLQPLSFSSLKICEPSLPESRPVFE
jgi:hypothetical protein